MTRISKLSKEEYLKFINNSSNKELLNSMKVEHKTLYRKEDITPENEKWVKVLMKADEIFERLES